MCNLYSLNKPRDYVVGLAKALRDLNNNQPPMPGIYPDYDAPIIRNQDGGRIMANARWGMPSPVFALKGRNSDPGVTNIRNTSSPHWRRWLGVAHRCLVPFTAFSEPENGPPGQRPPVWFAFNDSRPVAFFAGLWIPGWKSVRKVKQGETVNDLFGFLTTEPNAEVGAIHPKAMPVILRREDEWQTWLGAEWPEAAKLQRHLPDGVLMIVARGGKEDG